MLAKNNRKSQKKDTIHNKNNKPKYTMPRNNIHMKCVGPNVEKLKHNERYKPRLDRNDKGLSIHYSFTQYLFRYQG